MRILVTGAAGFIGSKLSERLLARGDEVLGYDNLNDYYDPRLKEARLARLTPLQGFSFRRAALEDRAALDAAFADFKPQRVVNLAAQAGVRYSLENPHAYIDANIVRSEEHTSELQSLMRISYAVFCLTKKNNHTTPNISPPHT